MDFVALRPCKGDMFEAVPRERLELDLVRCASLLSRAGYEIVSDPGVMLTVKREVEVTIYPHGRLMVFPAKTREEAARHASAVFSALGV